MTPAVTYRTAAAALTARALMHAGLLGGSPVANAEGGIVSSHRDPDGRMVALTTIGVWMKDCTEAERVALEIEFRYGELPLDAPRTLVPGARGYRKGRQSKTALASTGLGRRISARMFTSLVADGYAKVEARMLAVGALDVDAWRPMEG